MIVNVRNQGASDITFQLQSPKKIKRTCSKSAAAQEGKYYALFFSFRFFNFDSLDSFD